MKRKLVAIVFLLGLGSAAAWVKHDLYRPYRGFTGDLMLEFPPGTSARSIADLLVEHGVLAHRWPFLARYLIGRSHHRLKAGEYLFDRPLCPLDVYRRLIQGDVFLYTAVVPEGSDRFDMARIFENRLGIAPADFLRATEDAALVHDLDPAAPTLEGYLFPDTYRFPRRTTAATVVSTMVARFRHILRTRFGAELDSEPIQLHTVVTLASLVEKETPNPEERPVVAGVFTRRLEMGMALQCDPTVVYAARLADRPIGTIQASDLNFDSPFNTYRHAGLPPGPIASPGELSLRAAFHPDNSGALYFVSDNHGGHVFSATLSEHQRNVARYRRQVAARRRQAEPQPAPSTKHANRRARARTKSTHGSKASVSSRQ